MRRAGTNDRQQIIEKFGEAVNMTRKELEDWLQTDESRSVGQSDGGGESTDHRSGRRIVETLDKNKSDYTDDDLAHMKKVTGYVRRHQAQKPKGDIEDSNWRYSLSKRNAPLSFASVPRWTRSRSACLAVTRLHPAHGTACKGCSQKFGE